MVIKFKYLSLILLSSLTLSFLSCDDGRIYEEEIIPEAEEGKVMKFTGNISGIDSWARGYSLVLAGFDANKDFAVITQQLPSPDENGNVEVVMSNIQKDVVTLHLCVVNRQRGLVKSYVEMKCDQDTQDTIRMEGIKQNVNMFDAVQSQIFNDEEYGCIRCHGKTGTFAGGVNLLEGQSYNCLISKKSNIAANDTMVISSGNAEASTLYLILGTKYGKKLKYDHSNILINSYTDIALVRDWIDSGAKEK